MEGKDLKKESLKINGAIRIPASLKGSFFRRWFEFLEPIHKLTEREMDVIAALVKQRYELSKVVFDEDLLDKIVMSEDSRKKVMRECNISLAHFQVVLGRLRKNKIIVDNKINKKFIPQIQEDAKEFKYLLYFDMNDSQ